MQTIKINTYIKKQTHNVLLINAEREYKCTYGNSVIFCNLDIKIFLTNGKSIVFYNFQNYVTGKVKTKII